MCNIQVISAVFRLFRLLKLVDHFYQKRVSKKNVVYPHHIISPIAYSTKRFVRVKNVRKRLKEIFLRNLHKN